MAQILGYSLSLIHIIILCITISQAQTNTADDDIDNLFSSTSETYCTTKCTPGHFTKHEQCQYVKDCCAETLGDGDALFDYLNMQYCTFNSIQPLGAILLCGLLIFSFWMLGEVADEYFAPIMERLADVLNLSDELAGVTIVAFGNGAPDISASASAIIDGDDSAKLGLGALLGTAMFVPIIVSGLIAVVVKEPKVSATPFLRDCFFLFVAVCCVLGITSDRRVTLMESIGLIILYIFYVLSVLSREVYNKWKVKQLQIEISDAESNDDTIPEDQQAQQTRSTRGQSLSDRMMPIVGMYAFEEPLTDLLNLSQSNTNRTRLTLPKIMSGKELISMDDLSEANGTRLSVQRSSIKSRSHSSVSQLKKELDRKEKEDLEPVKEQDISWKRVVLFVIKMPLTLFRLSWKLTIPLIDEEEWNDAIAIASCIISPLFIQFAFAPDSMFKLINDQMPICAVVAIIGLVLSLITFWRVRRKYNEAKAFSGQIQQSLISEDKDDGQSTADKVKKQPVMKMFFLFLGFLSAVAWLGLIANELVNLMTTLGVISTIDLTLLGLTVLSWGISIGDLIANVSISRRGYAKMGISAALGGPTFNILIGVGIGTLINTIRAEDGSHTMPNTPHIFVSCICVMIGIATYAVWTAINKWTLKREFGYFCFVYYTIFLALIVYIYETQTT